MIVSFKHKGLEKFYRTGSTAGIQAKHVAKLRSLLHLLHTSEEENDFAIPSIRAHRLKGSRSNIWSVRVSGNWRLTFEFHDKNVHVLDYEDYH